MISNSELVKTIKKQGFATEQQINLIKRRINKSDESASEMFNLLDSVMPIRLTEEQKNKAAKWIYDKNFKNEQHTDPRMQKLRPVSRKEAYAADVTYGTNNEFGFDYLRDNMVNDEELLRQRELNFAIVDEVDSILIDEARTPLIISAPAAENPESYYTFAKIAAKLTEDDYVLEEKRRQVALTDVGVEKVQKILSVKNLYTPEYVRRISARLTCCLKWALTTLSK